VCRGADGEDVVGAGGCAGRQPNDCTFPVVTVAKAIGGLVLGHVPGVHDGVGAVVAYVAAVDLSGAAGAVAICGAGWFEAGTAYTLASIDSLGVLAKWDELTWYHPQRQQLEREHIHSQP